MQYTIITFSLSEPGFSGLYGLPGLRTVFILPVDLLRRAKHGEKVPRPQGFFVTRIAACLNGVKPREFCNSRKTRSERGIRLFLGRAFFAYFLYTSKESEVKFWKNLYITKTCRIYFFILWITSMTIMVTTKDENNSKPKKLIKTRGLSPLFPLIHENYLEKSIFI